MRGKFREGKYLDGDGFSRLDASLNLPAWTAKTLLSAHKPQLQSQFGVRSLALFGSTARGQAQEGSDVDILISFVFAPTSKQYFGARFYLEDVLQCPVDLVTEKALRQELRPYVERDAVHV